ncbi:hypothetical protein NE699_25150, partial [Escherichia coli]|uniref:hypothetical protein n=1 Tax=Escherichia coli TaxID=562 RepID=UPI00210D9BC5
GQKVILPRNVPNAIINTYIPVSWELLTNIKIAATVTNLTKVFLITIFLKSSIPINSHEISKKTAIIYND